MAWAGEVQEEAVGRQTEGPSAQGCAGAHTRPSAHHQYRWSSGQEGGKGREVPSED